MSKEERVLKSANLREKNIKGKVIKMNFNNCAIYVLKSNGNEPMSAEEISEKITELNLCNFDIEIEKVENQMNLNSENYENGNGKNLFKIVDDKYIIANKYNETVLLINEIYTEDMYIEFRKNKNSNIFEEVIEKMMLESCYDDSFKDCIEEIRKIISEKIPIDKKRYAILSILDKNRNLLRKAKIYQNMNITMMEHIRDYVSILRKYVKVSDVEKKKFGEVMTPIDLVIEMLETLPKKIWSDPSLKWLDPCNGVGPFGALVVRGLMTGLKKWEPDEEKRYKHIVENMVYVCELQPKNMFLWLAMMDSKDKFEMNIYCGSFLESGFDKHMKEVWAVDKFDIIIGNPPYNKGDTSTGNSIWDEFVILSIKILKKNGFLCFVHPTLWRKPQSARSATKKVSDIMMSKQIHYLKMHNTGDGLKIFDAGTRFDYYLLENCSIYTKTKINGEDRKDVYIDITKYKFLPNKGLEFFDKIIAKGNDERCPILYTTNYDPRKDWVSVDKNDIFKYTLVHSTPKKGNRFCYTSRNDKGNFGKSKIIFGESGIGDVIIDMDGIYGMTHGAMAIEISSLEEAENIKSVLLSKEFDVFLESVLWSNFRIDWMLFTYLKKDFWKEFFGKSSKNSK